MLHDLEATKITLHGVCKEGAKIKASVNCTLQLLIVLPKLSDFLYALFKLHLLLLQLLLNEIQLILGQNMVLLLLT